MLLEKGYLTETLEEFQSMHHKQSPSLQLIASVTKSVNVHNVFSEAIERSDLTTINYLLERGCDPNNKLDYCDQSSLERAAKVEDPKAAALVLDTLLCHGANIHELKGRESACTSDKKHLATVKRLIEHGADTNPTESLWIWESVLNTVDNATV